MTVGAHTGADDNGSVVEDRQFSCELVPLMGVHNPLVGAARFIDFHEPVEDKKEIGAPIATLEKCSAARKPLHHTEGNDSLQPDLVSAAGKSLCAEHRGQTDPPHRSRRKVAATNLSLSSSLPPSSINARDRRDRHGFRMCRADGRVHSAYAHLYRLVLRFIPEITYFPVDYGTPLVSARLVPTISQSIARVVGASTNCDTWLAGTRRRTPQVIAAGRYLNGVPAATRYDCQRRMMG